VLGTKPVLTKEVETLEDAGTMFSSQNHQDSQHKNSKLAEKARKNPGKNSVQLAQQDIKARRILAFD
jgi:hypothetical protein